jgi:hypothetical protein
MKAIITVTCPDCKGVLEIDVAREKIVAHRKRIDVEDKTADKGALFDDVVNRVRNRETEAEAKFREAQETVRDSKKRLDHLFGEMKKKVAEEKEKGPPTGPDMSRPEFWD